MATVRCSTHGIAYDDATHSGCGLCRRPELQERQARKRPFLLAAVGLLLGLLIAGGAFWVQGLPPVESPARPGKADEPSMPRLQLSPEEYRPQIEAIEAILYRKGPSELLDAERVEGAAQDLGAELLKRGTGLLLRSAAFEVAAFGAGAGASTDAGFANLDLSQTRLRWEAIRERLFAPAPWFSKASPEMEQAQVRTEPMAEPSAAPTPEPTPEEAETDSSSEAEP